jgi:hypothetical protein
MTKREQIRNVCINTELYIQNDPNYRGCIESGHFTERFDPLIKQLTSTPSEPEDELREELLKFLEWFRIEVCTEDIPIEDEYFVDKFLSIRSKMP